MHRIYIGLANGYPIPPASRVEAGQGRPSGKPGFTLVEMLVVMAIMLLLMGAGSVLFRSPISRAGEPAGRMVRCIEMARAKAVASNRNVAIRFDKQVAGSRDLVMRFLWARPGLAEGTPVKELEFRRAERFQNITISPSVGVQIAPQQSGTPPAHDLDPAADESLVFDADGQVMLGKGATGFPAVADQMEPLIRLGIQPTVAGMVVDAVKRDVAIVQVQCASGTARSIQP